MQQYPEFEILFGVHDLNDPCVRDIERLMRDFPSVNIRLIHCRTVKPNGKVGSLIDLAREARHAVLIVSDGDIAVPTVYLRDVVQPLSDPAAGIATCLYRATGDTLQARWEALGVATDFAPSALVAPFLGISEFGLGSTIVFRREDLEAIGGFESIADYIADDYQLGARIHALGRRNVMSEVVVDTHLHAATWGDAWRHQIRWARTIRVSRGAYAGLFLTHATFWAMVDAAAGLWWIALPLFAARMLTALMAGFWAMRSPVAAQLWFLIPFRDLWAAAIWIAGLFGHTVEWSGLRLTLDNKGRITKVE